MLGKPFGCNTIAKRDLDYLQNFLDQVNELLLETEEGSRYPSYELDSHITTWSKWPINVLTSLMESIQDHLMFVRLFSGATRKRAVQGLKEHKSILEALRMCDPQAAEERMRYHLHKARDNLLEKFSSGMRENTHTPLENHGGDRKGKINFGT